MPEKLHALHYEYVDGMAEKRQPHREAHLAWIARWHDEGKLAIAGALGDPPRAAFFGFRVDDPAEVEAYVAGDPYVQNGLVTRHFVEPWTVVT